MQRVRPLHEGLSHQGPGDPPEAVVAEPSLPHGQDQEKAERQEGQLSQGGRTRAGEALHRVGQRLEGRKEKQGDEINGQEKPGGGEEAE